MSSPITKTVAVDPDDAAKSAGRVSSESTSASSERTASSNPEKQLLSLFRGHQRTAKPVEETVHAFWDTQPVPKMTDTLPDAPVGPIDSSKTVDDVRPEPYPLPAPFRWVTCDIMDNKELEEIYILLNENYVEDEDNMFRFDYSKEFLRWALTVPGYNPDWHIGVRTDKGKLVAFITGIPATIAVYGTPVSMVEINFLCVHKKLRSKRLAPVLIKEVTRRVNRAGFWQAVYTAGINLTKPVSECVYYHRALNLKKLVEVNFTALRPRATMSIAQRLYRLPDKLEISNMRVMEKKDVPEVFNLLSKELADNTALYPIFTKEDIEHILLPRENVVVSYVRELDGKVTDFFSFYILPSSVIGHAKHKTLQAAYSYYYVAQTVSTTDLTNAALIVAREAGMDVFNALDLHNNREFIKDLKFGRGDGSLRYYLYNYLCPAMPSSKVGLVML